MAGPYRTPGVYVEEISKFPPSIAQVETAIPAFIGYTQRAKLQVDDDLHFQPRRILSLLEYEQFYGTTNPEADGSIIVTIDEVQDDIGKVIGRQATAQNSSPSAHNMYYAMQAYFANGGGPCYIISVGGLIGTPDFSQMQRGLLESSKEDEVTLLVFPEALRLSDANYGTLMSNAIVECGTLMDRFTIMDVRDPDPLSTILQAAGVFRGLNINQANLKYGAAYTPNIETIFNYFYEEASVVVQRSINGAAPAPDGKMADFNPANDGDGTQYAIIRAAIDDMPVVLPPSSSIAGVYATVDRTRGVWKAPANESLGSILKPTVKITNLDQEQLNVHPTGKSINAIRSFIGKGTLVWGARTLDGNSNEWRYVSVRRFFNMVEESTKKATERFVFEPNDANTWVKVRAMIENFLITMWNAGALQGATPEKAFFVKVGLGETMTALDILEGRMIVEIGMAVVRPAEFIILRFSHKMPEA